MYKITPRDIKNDDFEKVAAKLLLAGLPPGVHLVTEIQSEEDTLTAPILTYDAVLRESCNARYELPDFGFSPRGMTRGSHCTRARGHDGPHGQTS